MHRTLPWIIGLLVMAGGVLLWFMYRGAAPAEPRPIGGERDAHGCLVAGGYAYDESVGACIRALEMTEDIKAAAKLAVQKVGQGYALTVVSFNSYEERGTYDITLERGESRTRETVQIRQNQIVPGPGQGIFPYQSGVKGAVLLGPTCPVMQNPPDTACADKGYQTTVRVFRSASSAAYATTKSAANGSFIFSLPPGEYRVEAEGGSMLPRCAPIEVTVGPSGYVAQDISCDTGIR